MSRSWTMPRVSFPVGWSSLRTTETSAPRATSLRFRPSIRLAPLTAPAKTSLGLSITTIMAGGLAQSNNLRPSRSIHVGQSRRVAPCANRRFFALQAILAGSTNREGHRGTLQYRESANTSVLRTRFATVHTPSRTGQLRKPLSRFRFPAKLFLGVHEPSNQSGEASTPILLDW